MDKPVEKFDEDLWGAFIEYIMVYSNGNKEVFIKDGTSFILVFTAALINYSSVFRI